MIRPRPLRPVLALITLFLAASASPVAAAPLAEPTVIVSVATERMISTDQFHRAGFVAVGACVPPSDDVHVTRQLCSDDPAVVDETEGTVRKARLGFDAVRRVEAVPAQAPVAETPQAAAPEQLESVDVVLRESGDLTVQITGHLAQGLDPRPVPGSASSGGTVSDRTVVWQREGASPGTYAFSARFRPGAPAGFTGSFAPEVQVTLRTRSSSLLQFEMGSLAGPADRASTLTMAQRVSPAYGPPGMSVAGYSPVQGAGGLPVSWDTNVAMDARGSYLAPASGDVSTKDTAPFEELAPGSLGVVDSAFMFNSYFDVRGQAKATPWMNFEFTQDHQPSAFVSEVRTTPLADPFSLRAGSTIWDGDAMAFGIGAGFHTLDNARSGKPTNSLGTIRPDWGEGVVRNASATWANVAPGGEPNVLNPWAHLRSVVDYGILHRLDATIPMVVAGGDVDNRGRSSAVVGDPATIALPPGQCPFSAVWLSIFLAETKYSASLSPLASCPGSVDLTPQAGAGAYWLESFRDGYYRDWSNVTHLSLTATEEDGASRQLLGSVRQESVVLIPAGAAAVVNAADAVTGPQEELELGPGLWRISFSPGRDGLAAVRVG